MVLAQLKLDDGVLGDTGEQAEAARTGKGVTRFATAF